MKQIHCRQSKLFPNLTCNSDMEFPNYNKSLSYIQGCTFINQPDQITTIELEKNAVLENSVDRQIAIIMQQCNLIRSNFDRVSFGMPSGGLWGKRGRRSRGPPVDLRAFEGPLPVRPTFTFCE